MPPSEHEQQLHEAMDALGRRIAEHFDELEATARAQDKDFVADRWVRHTHIDPFVQQARDRAASEAATGLDEANWSREGALGRPPTGLERADPLPRPALPFVADLHGPGYEPQGPTLDTIRHIWLARYNPSDNRWVTPEGHSGSDVAAPGVFGWGDPATVVVEGRNYWLSSLATPGNRGGILELETGDLVVVQRSSPGPGAPPQWQDARSGNGDVLYGLAAVWQIEEWDDADTCERERRVGLLPLCAFTYPVSRSQVRRRGRLNSERFSRMRQHLDGSGPMGFTLTPVTDDRDINELLAVCGLSAEALTEPDLTVVAARVSATTTGDKDLFDLRWDNRYRHLARLRHEHLAVLRAREWAHDMQWQFVQTAERVPLAGYDLLFNDPAIPLAPWRHNGSPAPSDPLEDLNVPWNGRPMASHVEVEVKGYSAADLRFVHLQPSQARRARDSAAGLTPPWWLFALLGAGGPHPIPVALSAGEVVEALRRGELQVR